MFFTAALAVWFGNLEFRKLVRPDEGRYAEIPREMTAGGDWVTPRLNGIKYFEKPPLQYWATAVAYTAFGQHHWTARLWPALTGLLGVLLVGWIGGLLFGPGAGPYAALALGSSVLYTLIAHINTLDMGVTFFLTAALAGFLYAQRPEATPAQQRYGMAWAWAALGGSVLSKGLMGLAVPGGALLTYSLLARDFGVWRRLRLGLGLPLLLLLTVPWFVTVSLANPEFPRFFFIHEHFERFLTRAHGRYQPGWYFVPILLLGILPWLVTLLSALRQAWQDKKSGFHPQRFLLAWVGFTFVFFSVSGSKLPSYILPLFPAAALLMGWHLTQLSGRQLSWHALPAIAAGAVGLALVPQVTRLASIEVPEPLYQAYRPWLTAAALTALATGGAAFVLARQRRCAAAVLALAAGGLGAAQLGLTGHDALSPASSAYHLAQQIRPHLKPGIPFYSVATYEQTLPFYIERTVTLVAYRDELSFGLDQEPGLGLPDLAAFRRAWREQPEALALMSPQTYAQLAAEGLPMAVVARDTRRVVVKTLPPAIRS